MRKKLIFTFIVFLFFLALLEVVCHLLVASDSEYETIRRIKLGDNSLQVHNERVIAQPYLNYVPAPGLEKKGYVQHNEHGYRGKLVPMMREENELRILCLGGSTTYGWSAPNPDDAYPAQLERILRDRQTRWKKVNVINAGTPSGTSGELLTQYLFKFRYYKPDVVIINTGGNDVAATLANNYSPDYSHYRKPLPAMRPLPAYSAWVFHSRLAAYVSIAIFFPELTAGQTFYTSKGKPVTNWFGTSFTSPQGLLDLEPDELAFRRNLQSLIREVRADNAKAVLVPFRWNREKAAPRAQIKNAAEYARHENVLKEVGEKMNVTIAPFPFDTITTDNWVDNCHLNGPGCREKAAHIAEYVMGILPDRPESK